MLLPLRLTAVNIAFALPPSARSAIRPPQPRPEPSAETDCHTDCWSLWENSFGGVGAVPARKSALLVGPTSGPTLLTKARRWLVNSDCTLPRTGCTATVRPWALSGLIGSTPPRRACREAPASCDGGVPGAARPMPSLPASRAAV